MGKRKFSKCSWCNRSIDITSDTRKELCKECAEYPNFEKAMKHYEETKQYKRIRFRG